MKRKHLRLLIKVLGGILLLFGLLGFLSVVLLIALSFREGYDAFQDYWNMAYYTFAIMGSIGTVLAVIVALEKETFNQILYSPEFEVSSSSRSPKVTMSSTDTKVVQKYSQYLRITNIGAADAKGCKIELVRLSFDKNKHHKFKEISPLEQSAMTCGSGDGLITKQNPYEFLLFEVVNPGVESNPNPNNQDVRTASIVFNGITLLPRHASMGQYILEYRLSCEGDVSKSFTVEVDWGGEWSDDVDEMIDKFETRVK